MDEKKRLNSAGVCAAGLLLVALGLGGVALWRAGEAAPAPTVEVTDPVTQPAPHYTPQTIDPEPEKPEPPVLPTAQPVVEIPELPVAAGESETVPVEPSVPTLVVYPVSGRVTAAFSADELQYNDTLDDWRVHDGIDLSAKLGTTVLSACAGTVLTVEDDPLMGTTVTVEHAGGYQTRYANLQTKPPVRPGDEVAAGQIIGAVGRTAEAESQQPPHLHFSVSREGELLNPEAFLNP